METQGISGDTVLTTDNPLIIKGVKNLPPIICPNDSKTEKVIITEKDLQKSNLKGFNNNVGKATNRASTIRDIMAWFSPESEEYKELEKREMSIQRIQQEIIDAVKNAKPPEQVPKTWYSVKANEVITEEVLEEIYEMKKKLGVKQIKLPKLDTPEQIERKLFNMKIVANKKPYFFIYIYDNLMNQVKKYKENWNNNCLRTFGKSINELVKNAKTEEEKDLLDTYYRNFPVNIADSLMNTICRKFESEFDDYFRKKQNQLEFDYSIMKTDREYDKKTFNSIKQIYNEYRKQVKEYVTFTTDNEEDKEFKQQKREEFKEEFQKRTAIKCEDEQLLCNIVLDLTYGNKENPQFAWDVCGEVIIKNLLAKNNNEITYFEKDNHGIIEFGGERFTMKKKKVDDKIWESQ